MKKYVVIALSIMGLIVGLYAQKVVYQTDWHGGPGQEGPIEGIPTGKDAEYDFGLRFDTSWNINYLYEWGRLSLTIVLNSDTNPNQHHIGDMTSRWDKKIEPVDIDKDGDVDVVSAGDNEIRWYENDGVGNFTSYHTIYSTDGGHYIGYDLKDFDDDGDMDIVICDHNPSAGDEDSVVLYLNDGHGNFSYKTKIGDAPNNHQVCAEDFDNDGDVDVVSTGFHSSSPSAGDAHWFENSGNNTTFTHHLIGDDGNGSARRINRGDLDGDGDIDFVVTGPHGTYWFENIINSSGTDPGFTRHTLNTYNNRYDWVEDVDRDGDLDIVTANLSSNHPVWWENNGDATSWTEHPLDPPSDGTHNPEGVVVIDVDYDGDMDIIQSFWNGGAGGVLGWYENDGFENFSYRKFTDYPYSCDIQVADINGNGFYDLVSANHNPGTSIDWWDLFDHFESPGELYSSIFDSRIPNAIWINVEKDDEIKPETWIDVYIRASDDSTALGTWVKADPNGSISGVYGRYMQYRLVLSSNDGEWSPLLYEVRFTYFGGDLGIDSIIIPSDTIPLNSTLNPKIKIVNTYPVMNDECEVVFEIYRDSYETEPVYCDTEYVYQITPSEFEYITFDKEWTPDKGGVNYYLRAYLIYDYDRDESNNELKDTTYVLQGIGERKDDKIVLSRVGNMIKIEGISGEVMIYNITGSLIDRFDVNGKLHIYHFNNTPPGIYYIMIKNKNKLIRGKVIVLRS